MKDVLVVTTEYTVIIINFIALVVIAFGTIEAVVGGVRLLLGSRAGHERREVWLRYARWLVAGLSFQLAADILDSAIATSWESVGRLGAIAVIRTFLNYFLERDLAEVREREAGVKG